MSLSVPPLLLHVFPTFAVGGSQNRFAAIANHFGARFRHRIVALDGDYGCRERLDPGLACSILEPPIAKRGVAANLIAFRRVLAATRPDLLVTYNWGAIEWAMANWPGLVRHIHIEDGFGVDEAQGQLRRRVWTRRLVLRRSIVVLPSRTLHRIAREIWRLPENHLRHIPNGIDCARFAAMPAEARRIVWPGAGPVIGTVAALRPEKNLARLIRAFHRIARQQPCRLVIVGEGPERAALAGLAEHLGLGGGVTFTGHVASPQALYRGFDIFALSSDTEQMPYTILEAMASGLPVVATAVGDIADMVAPENLPFLVPPDDDALAASLHRLLGDAEACRRIGAANRAKAERDFEREQMFAAYGALFAGDETPRDEP